MSKYGYLVVEGHHDVEFVARILKPYGLDRIEGISDLDPFWYDLIPKNFPPNGEDFQKRVPVPVFLQSNTHSVAIRSAGGNARLVPTMRESLAVLDSSKLVGVGFVLDADEQVTPTDHFSSIKTKVTGLGVLLELPDNPGQVRQGNPKSGIFVLPDNQSQGTLEDVLLECAETAYPSLLTGARKFVRGVDVNDLTRDDRNEFNKRAGRKKAVASSISSILKPGKTIQVSIRDNRWLKDDALDLPRVKAVQTFLAELLEFA